MARVLVIAHLNHDRIWELDGPLKSGSRVSWGKRETRLGGGGYFTGSPFLALGHEVALVSSLGNDALGDTARSELSELGFDMQHVYKRDSGTHITDILLEPSGERTILTPSRDRCDCSGLMAMSKQMLPISIASTQMRRS
ncbi:hypothetical protein DEA98_18920 [Brucella pseudogrignonensis]|nr:hypothetical protein [Brucella pseudogrignonensis]